MNNQSVKHPPAWPATGRGETNGLKSFPLFVNRGPRDLIVCLLIKMYKPFATHRTLRHFQMVAQSKISWNTRREGGRSGIFCLA